MLGHVMHVVKFVVRQVGEVRQPKQKYCCGKIPAPAHYGHRAASAGARLRLSIQGNASSKPHLNTRLPGNPETRGDSMFQHVAACVSMGQERCT